MLTSQLIPERSKCILSIRFRVESLYGYIFSQLIQTLKHILVFLRKELLLMKDEGLIEKIGVSLNSNEEIEDRVNAIVVI